MKSLAQEVLQSFSTEKELEESAAILSDCAVTWSADGLHFDKKGKEVLHLQDADIPKLKKFLNASR